MGSIFVFGPCEPLIPFFMYPAPAGEARHVWVVSLAFASATLLTMTALVAALCKGAQAVRLKPWERFGHAAAGAVVVLCGVAVSVGL